MCIVELEAYLERGTKGMNFIYTSAINHVTTKVMGQ
jgi:hypothetical protein